LAQIVIEQKFTAEDALEEDVVTDAGRLRVMSLNLRGPDDDEPNRWPSRLPVVAGLLRDRLPDLVGTQEGRYPRLEDLADELGDLRYRWIGLGREGGSRSEFVAIFYRHDRFHPVAFDHFWLSPSPRTIGSVLPESNSAIPRMVTWARFRERATGRELVHVNSHLDHRSDRARIRSAELIGAFVASLLQAGDRVILTGDFNAAAVSSRPYQVLTRVLADTWPADGTERPATFHGYRHPSLQFDGERCIDWILASSRLSPVAAEVLAVTKPGSGGRVYPSDHWPVLADLRLE
jgi:endonuclease/exonuclease/phosphatase family metal-dependent hydrolase